jgi:hypothetical protein
MLLNGFDLIRVHRFGDLEEKKSFNAMCEFAMSLDKVKMQIAAERKEKVDQDFESTEIGSPCSNISLAVMCLKIRVE